MMPPRALKSKKRDQRRRLVPARNAAYARSTATKRPKKTTLLPCFMNKYCPSFSLRSSKRIERSKRREPPVAALAFHPEAQVIAQDRESFRCEHDHQRDGELLRRPGSGGGHEQHGLAGERNAGALNGHEEQDRPVAAGDEQMRQARSAKVKHLSDPSSTEHATTRTDHFSQQLAIPHLASRRPASAQLRRRPFVIPGGCVPKVLLLLLFIRTGCATGTTFQRRRRRSCSLPCIRMVPCSL